MNLVCFCSIGILFVILLNACVNKDPAEKYRENIISSIKYEKKGNYKKALELINKSLKIDSNQSYPFVIRGKIYSMMDADRIAIEDFTKAIFLNPKNTSAYFHKAVSFSLLDNEDSAIAYFNRAIITKQDGEFSFERINYDFLDFEDQVDIPLKVIRYNRGISFYSKEDDSLALEDFRFSLKYEYNKVESQFFIGVILLHMGDSSNGCNYLKEAKLNGSNKAEDYLIKFCN